MRTKKTCATEQGRKLKAAVVSIHGSIHKAAALAGIHEKTLRRAIYEDPARMTVETAKKLVAVGVPKDLLL